MGDNGKSLTKKHISMLLKTYGFSPRKRFGQNFLVDRHIAEKIIESLKPGPDDVVVEIGPGAGVLTEGLLDTGAKVIAVEIDRGLVDILGQRFKGRDNLELLNQDTLKVRYSRVAGQYGKRLKVVSNLPYNISTPVIFKLLDEQGVFSMFLLMLQKEVAERIVSPPGTREYGVLSVFTQLLADVNIEFDIPPSCFYPSPRVYSSVVRFNVRHKPLIEIPDIGFFKKVVKASFGQRRKTIFNALKVLKLPTSLVKCALQVSGIDPQRRGETLSLRDFGILSKELNKIP